MVAILSNCIIQRLDRKPCKFVSKLFRSNNTYSPSLKNLCGWGRRPPLRYKVNVILNTSLQNINQLPQQLQENESQLKSDQQLLCLINKPMTSYHCICYNNYRSTSLPSQCPTFL